ncbi:Lrp/AsnC family transcriptional regulator [Cumulibacter manganitolerans]|uniref:Lrp/AsnC family transcriptional regulator n=1 Tax=Cumulibacter manganitolerans TaxID=1884992 RepID=UPI001294932E|nr:Lrp/AsnC family transcriptional regulator [Cumulibacter manganitolerans]
MRLDDLDLRLLALLSERPRIGDLELSRLAGVARGTVTSRLARLVDAGVIRGYEPQVDLAAAGFAVHAFVSLQIAQGRLEDVRRGLEQVPEVIEAYATTGDHDVFCKVAARSHEGLQQALLAVDTVDGVTRSNSIVVLSEVVARRVLPLLHTGDPPDPARAAPPTP